MDRRSDCLAEKFQSVFSEPDLNELGREIDFSRRERVITPFRLALSLTESLACNQVETLADLHRGFNAFFGEQTPYKAFYNQVAKEQFPELMVSLACTAISGMCFRVLGFEDGRPFSEFGQILIQDGTSFSVKDELEFIFPGRFNHISPAAVELHTTMDVLSDSAVSVVLTPDTAGEKDHLPEPRTLKDRLLLTDRGYLNLGYMHRVDRHGGKFIMRGKEGLNPWILDARMENGKRPRRFRNKKLQEVLPHLPKRQAADLTVGWVIDGQPVVFRMIVTWNSEDRAFQYLITNLDPERYPLRRVCLGYRLRWQVELLFKEWKSYANLHAFDTRDPHIAEGLIWAAIVAAILKRFLAHATQLAARVQTSTRKAAMCGAYVIRDIFRALRNNSLAELRNAWKKGIDYLAFNACRAHPKRDRKTGRSALGLEPLSDLYQSLQMDNAA